MHSSAFTSEEKKKLQEIAKGNNTVAIAIEVLSKKAVSKEDKKRRLLAKDICTDALTKELKVS